MDTLEMQSKALYHCHHCGHDQHISAVVTAAKDVQTHDVDGKIESEKLTTAKCCECAREMWEVHATWHLTYGKVQHTRTTNAIYKALRTSCGEVVVKADTGIKPIREVKESAFTVKFTPADQNKQIQSVRDSISNCYRSLKSISQWTGLSIDLVDEILKGLLCDDLRTRVQRKSIGTEYTIEPIKAYVAPVVPKWIAKVTAPLPPVEVSAPVIEAVPLQNYPCEKCGVTDHKHFQQSEKPINPLCIRCTEDAKPVVRNTPKPPRPYFALKTVELESQAKSDLPGVLHELTFRKSNAALKLLETLSVGVK